MEADLLKLCGRVINGRYRIEEQLGAGGMGVVYKATQLQLHQKCAIKLIVPQQNPLMAQVMRRRFRREAQLGFRVRHEGLVAVFDFDQLEDNTPFYAMELLGGRSLRDLLSRAGPLSWTHGVEIGLQAADALAALHQAQVIHRDLKPDNMQLLDDGRVKVLDLGVIHAEDGICADENDITDIRTHTGERIGTPEYMAPEQLRDSKRVDASTDVYGLCLVIYEMITAQQPFRGQGFEEIVQLKFTQHPVPPLRLFCPEAPAALESILHCSLGERQGRPQSMAALQAQLEPLLGGQRIALRQQLAEVAQRVPQTPPPIWEYRGLADPLPAARAATDPLPAPGPDAQRPEPARARGRRPLVWGAACAILLALVSGLAWRTRHRTPEAGPSLGALSLPVQTYAAREEPAQSTLPAIEENEKPAPRPNKAAPAQRSEAGKARLRVAVIPFAEVYIDGALQKEGTPFTYTLPAGRHTVRIINPSLRRDESRSLKLGAGTTTQLNLDWSQP